MWKNRRVLVTGATGLLGSHLVEELCRQEADVTCVVRDYIPRSRYYSCLITANEVTGDVEDYDFLSRVMNEYQVQTVFHLAAQTQVGIANKNPIPTFRTNIMGTVNVLDASRLNGVEQVLIASSDKAYGDHVTLPYDENTPLRGLHPYDVSKSCADLIAQTYAKTYRMNVGITRCGNLFGPGDLNFNRLIPGTIQSLLNNQSPVIRSDGKMIRDYFYVKDAVIAYMLLAEFLLSDYNRGRNKIENCFNFSYGEPRNVVQMVAVIELIMQNPKVPTILNEASNEIQEQYLDSKRARDVLEWKPRWSMETALKETIEWYKENL